MRTQSTPAGNDPARHLNRALAALREAREALEDAITCGERLDVNAAAALSQVAAARAALRPNGMSDTPARDAA